MPYSISVDGRTSQVVSVFEDHLQAREYVGGLSVVIYFVDANELPLGGTSVWISQAVLKQITLTPEFPSFTFPFGQVSSSRAQ